MLTTVNDEDLKTEKEKEEIDEDPFGNNDPIYGNLQFL